MAGALCFSDQYALTPNPDEETAIRTLEERASRAPGFSTKFLRDKVFGRFDSDLEFRLVMYAAAPLYSEHFDAEVALKSNLETVFYAKSHSKFPLRDEIYGITLTLKKTTSIPTPRSTSTIQIGFSISPQIPS